MSEAEVNLGSHLITNVIFQRIKGALVSPTRCEAILHYFNIDSFKMSRIVRKPDFCLGENKGADQLR